MNSLNIERYSSYNFATIKSTFLKVYSKERGHSSLEYRLDIECSILQRIFSTFIVAATCQIQQRLRFFIIK